MIKRAVLVLVAILLVPLFSLSAAFATSQLVDEGNSVFDTYTGLRWLKLTETLGWSWNQVNAGLLPGGALEGWQLASHEQIVQLVADAGLPTASSGTSQYISEAQTFITLFGATVSRTDFVGVTGYRAGVPYLQVGVGWQIPAGGLNIMDLSGQQVLSVYLHINATLPSTEYQYPYAGAWLVGASSVCPDEDSDGVRSCGGDCNDTNSSIFPGAPELCDGKDNNCDGLIPEFESDKDLDGYLGCNECNDNDPEINPATIELPGNAVDENCDGDLGSCSPILPWKTHGQYVRCVAQEAERLTNAGDLTEQEADDLVTSAAQSDIGKK